jgi:hypothetical protein
LGFALDLPFVERAPEERELVARDRPERPFPPVPPSSLLFLDEAGGASATAD